MTEDTHPPAAPEIEMQEEDLRKLHVPSLPMLFVTWGGCGFMRPAPGTWGSLGALPIGIILYITLGVPGLAVAAALLFALAVPCIDRLEASGRLTEHDSPMIVIDEVVGQWIALLPVFALNGLDIYGVIGAVMLFRFFDITKIWPACRIDRTFKGGLGVMADDVVAGFYAALIMIGYALAGSG
jgi:phosphatidylglycerophosphatase A